MSVDQHLRYPVVDTHNDLLMLVSRRDPSHQAAYFRDHWLPQLADGGVNVQVLPVFIDDEYRPEGALRQTLRMISAAHRVAAENGEIVALCTTGEQIDIALESGRLALVLALEGCEAVGTDLEIIEPLFRLGVRMASFTHFGRTALADGSAEDATGGGLTRAGVAALDLMQRLGILVDVSHLSAAGTDDVLARATRPVVASHSSAYALRPHHRNLTDERLKGIAATGGVVGVNFFHGFVDPDNPTVGRVVDHIEHVASVAGIEHVGFGPDFVSEIYAELKPNMSELVEGLDPQASIPGLDRPAGLPLVTEELLRRGWRDGDVEAVLGGNWLRVFRGELGRPAGEKQSATGGARPAASPPS